MTVEVKTTIRFKPWRAPNYAVMEAPEGRPEGPTIPVSDLDADALEAMAKAWLDDLYAGTVHFNPFRSTTSAP